ETSHRQGEARRRGRKGETKAKLQSPVGTSCKAKPVQCETVLKSSCRQAEDETKVKVRQQTKLKMRQHLDQPKEGETARLTIDKAEGDTARLAAGKPRAGQSRG